MPEVYQLKVTQIDRVCLFELTWGQGRQIVAKLPYPTQLETLHQTWQQMYLAYYQSLPPSGPPLESSGHSSEMRAIAIASGQITSRADWHGQLVQAEARLLSEFHKWLRDGALFDIRSEIGRRSAGNATKADSLESANGVDLLITCDPIALGRLPWEAWELGAEFGASGLVRIARLPVNVRAASVRPPKRGKANVLVVLGDDTGLSFTDELEAIAALKSLANIHVIGWQPGAQVNTLKQTICKTIQSSNGWDMLLFFGHSNEASAVGGQIAIAPNATLSLRELEPALQRAKANGLQFALFNSCKGLDIADSLINLGLNQVVVMREPIHNRVAQVFLIQFLQSLSLFDDVHTALHKASQSLRSDSNLTYPSAHLVPSLFRHKEAELFRLHAHGWRAVLEASQPKTRWQKIAAFSIAALSLIAPVNNSLIAGRLWVQALYRDSTIQVPSEPPPVILIQIDQDSLRDLPSVDVNSIDRTYLAQIIDRLAALDTNVIGVDYLFDYRQETNDKQLATSISQAAERGKTLIFSAVVRHGTEIGVREELANLNKVMQGYTETPRWYLKGIDAREEDTCDRKCPFAYITALTQAAQTDSSVVAAIQPDRNSQTNLRETVMTEIGRDTTDNIALQALYSYRLPLWKNVSGWWGQRWLQPILDFSVPPQQIYHRISARDLIAKPEDQLDYDWKNSVVMIASGGYRGAGTEHELDYVEPPWAIAHWYQQMQEPPAKFTGGEANAYAVHHFLREHYVTPIPDIWLVCLCAIAAPGLLVLFSSRQLSMPRQRQILTAITLGYGLVSLQVFISALVLLPWLLPASTLWIYCLPSANRSQPIS